MLVVGQNDTVLVDIVVVIVVMFVRVTSAIVLAIKPKSGGHIVGNALTIRNEQFAPPRLCRIRRKVLDSQLARMGQFFVDLVDTISVVGL